MPTNRKGGTVAETTRLVLARFDDPHALLVAARKVREAGYCKFDCHSPFPIHGMDQAMGLKRSPLGWIIGLAALVGTSFALWLQWWTSSVAYPVVISGKPFFSYQAYLPITFGFGVLAAAFAAVVGMLILNGLPRLFHPLFYSKQFESVSDDGFFISVESSDPKFEEQQITVLLESLGGKSIEVVKS